MLDSDLDRGTHHAVAARGRLPHKATSGNEPTAPLFQEQQASDAARDALPLPFGAEVTRRQFRRVDMTASERHRPRRLTRPRLPVRPGDASHCAAPTTAPSTDSHELLNSKHKGSSLAGTARSAAFGQSGRHAGMTA